MGIAKVLSHMSRVKNQKNGAISVMGANQGLTFSTRVSQSNANAVSPANIAACSQTNVTGS